MNSSSRWFAFSVCLLFGAFAEPARAQSDSLAKAAAALDAAAARAQSDPAHPIFHVTSPANWMNDPNGPIFYQGHYHLFYQLNPFSDGDGPKYWGHVQSSDLVKWERLPIAIAPSTDRGETGVWSGCCTINGDGVPMIFYTSVTDQPAQTHAEQWAALGDPSMVTWTKSPKNPVLSEALHGDRKIYEWRDPFIFHFGNRTFMVLGGNLNKTAGGQAVVNIYEAKNRSLTDWKYRGVLFQLPDADARTVECPNFFNLDGRWVLICSPSGPVQYYVGQFDPVNCRFKATSRGLVDNGPNFYAPNTMQLADGRRILWGWVPGFPEHRGWNGCLTLPRLLSLGPDGDLLQTPAPQLRGLRGQPIASRAPALFALHGANAVEIEADIAARGSTNISLSIGSQAISFPVNLPAGGPPRIKARVFVDHSVLEVFANGWTATKVIPVLDTNVVLRVSSSDHPALPALVNAWSMKSIW